MGSISVGQLLQWLGAVSILTFVVSLLVVPWLILFLPANYFIQHRLKVEERHQRHPVLTIILFVLRNVIGLGLLAAGIAMLILPGQGILTMVIALSVMDFPGKHHLLEKGVQNRKIQQSLNWIRGKGGKEKLIFAVDQAEG
jgi:archaellum biogenesis protein FlaJ (TadC family)